MPEIGQNTAMKERSGLVTMRGRPLTLVGNEVEAGALAPDFEALNNNLESVRLSSFKGKVVVISTITSLDTMVCDIETRHFNEEAEKLGPNVVIMVISMDLPFAQKRWSEEAGVKNVQLLSDHREASFGLAYGTLIKGLRLLARTVFIIDREGVVRYVQYVKDTGEEPDYDEVLEAVKKII
jgi:thiol peroxidase